MRIPVLAYQPMVIGGNDYASSHLKALAADLRHLTREGFRVMPLRAIVDAWLDRRAEGLDGRIVAITSDDGADFDYRDLDHPTAGRQRSAVNILRDLRAENPAGQPQLNVTAFAIASPEARAALDKRCMVGKDWWSDAWWPEAVATGLLHIASHSWDHNHEALPSALRPARHPGTFRDVDSKDIADHEIATAARYLRDVAPNPGDALFAYPYGESNAYLVREYFPRHGADAGVKAAFTGRAGFLEPGTDRWEIPRLLFGRDWTSPAGLQAILDAATGARVWVPVHRAAPMEGGSTELREFRDFLAARVESIPGWLNVEAALLTAHLAGAQRARGVHGPTLELGVYRGKYLSVLYKLAAPDEAVVGVDLFIGSRDTRDDVKRVKETVALACGDSDRLRVVVADTRSLTSRRLRDESQGAACRFISVDAGHTAQLVHHDLEVATPLLAPGGIMALDDVFNTLTPGVGEGVARFFIERNPALAPFAICYNKVFVTTPESHRACFDAAMAFLDAAPWLAAVKRTREMLADKPADGFRPAMFGYDVVTFA